MNRITTFATVARIFYPGVDAVTRSTWPGGLKTKRQRRMDSFKSVRFSTWQCGLTDGFKGIRPTVAATLVVLCLAPVAAAFDEQRAPQPRESDTIRSELDDIFAQPEFRRLRNMYDKSPAETTSPDWLKRAMQRFWDLLTGGAESLSSMGALWQALAYMLLAVVSCLIVWLIVRAVNSYRYYHDEKLTRSLHPDEGEVEVPPGDLPADEYLRRADELARSQRYREAVAQLLLGGMSRIERSGLIRFRRGLTHRDYLRALRNRAAAQRAFRTLVGVYEPIGFGRREAHSTHFDASLAAYRTGFGELSELPEVG